MILTHSHADAIMGLDDLRAWTLNACIQPFVDVYLNAATMAFVSQVFPYLVDTSKASGGGDVAGLRFHVMTVRDDGTYEALNLYGMSIQPFDVEHGKLAEDPFMCLGFRFNNVVYVSDTNAIPPSSQQYLNDAEIIILDALHDKKHFSHLSIEQAVDELVKDKPALAFLTGFSHRVDQHPTQINVNAMVRAKSSSVDIRLAFDGLRVKMQ